MKAFEEYNPIALAVYFMAAAGIAMFCMNPVILLLSLGGAFAQNIKGTEIKTHMLYLGIFAVTAIINPIVSHKGKTVLLVINHNPITLESAVYGIFAAVMMISVIYRFSAFSKVMTRDKLLYIFGRFSPKMSLILSMAMRYVPLFSRQAKKTADAQKAMGFYKDDNIIDSFYSGTRVFSVMITWALENGIITADSMSARGYGIKKRTSYSVYTFAARDVILTAFSLTVTAVFIFCMAKGKLDYAFYPEIIAAEGSAEAYILYILYGMLSFIPTVHKAAEEIRWKYLISKI